MPPEHRTTTTTILLLLLLLAAAEGKSGGATKFDFATLTLGSLKLIGDAHLRNGSIRLSRDLPVPNSGAGRALYADPIRLLHPTTRLAIPFSTSFSFTITNLNPSSIGGGLAFLLSPDDHSLGESGAFLGILNSTSSPSSQTVAVEFDTLMDLQFDDINDNHVGIDLNSIVSAQSADLDSASIDLHSGDLINAWIDYGGTTTTDPDPLLEVFVSYSAARPADPVLSLAVDLGRYLDGEFVYVGFSGSTQGSTEIHSIQWWTFSSTSPAATSKPPPPPMVFSAPIPPPPPAPTAAAQTPIAPSNAGSAESPASSADTIRSSPSRCRRCKQGAVAGVAATGSVFFVAAFAGLLFWAKKKMAAGHGHRWDNLASASEIVKSPREFSYRELNLATHSFNPCRIIGHGAVGTVYRGVIPSTGAIVAVKRCIGGGDGGDVTQGRAEFLSELSIIASLRHRHLVRLQGWCHEKGEILLVYDYMIHGSLDKALFESGTGSPPPPPLPWRHRRRILCGVASALAYLHHECERQVIHRDVKSSNVMLDEGYHARLGDFGLARQIEHDMSPDATVTAGTMGYLAPEYLLTGRATEKTDVFSFGAVVLEVVSGRRPINGDGESSRRKKKGRNLVEWVWGLHGEGRVMEAVDARMGGEFEEGEVRRTVLVGLACSSPDPTVRPGMRAVVQMLSGEADPPFVPSSKPSMSFSTTNHHLLMSLQDSVSDCNAMGFNLSSSSSASSSLTESFRPAGGGGEL